MNVQAGRHALWILAAVLLAAAAVDHAVQTASAQTVPAQATSGGTPAAGASEAAESPAASETRVPVPSRTATGNGSTGSSPDGVAAGESSVGKPGFVYIPGANGELIPVLQNSTFEEFLTWLRERDQPALPAAVESGITSISFDGHVVENRAILDATIQIQVNVADQWQEIPIYCNEAVLLEADYEGPGEAVPGDTPQRNTGYHWWVRGKGTHTVKLKLSLPVAVQVPVSRLQLTLPVTPLSVLRMRVPLAGISAKGPDRASLSTRTVSETESEILVYGLGPRLDVSYRPLPATNATELVLQAATTLTVELSSDSALIRGVQKVQALQGSFESIEVQLPQGFDLLDFESQDYRDYDVTEDNRAIVTLREPTTGPVELRWTVQSEQAAEDNVWILGGFDVLHARRHMGDVSVFPAEGFKVTAPETGSRYVNHVKKKE